MNTLLSITREETKGAQLTDVITYIAGKLMDFKNAHASIHIPGDDRYMDCRIIIGYEHLGTSSRFSIFYRSFYTNDEGAFCFCDSTEDHCEWVHELRDAIKTDFAERADLYDTIYIIEGAAPICTHP